jgi:chemotaxis protein MotA
VRFLAIFGITLSLGALFLGHTLAGGSLAALFQPAALLIVFGGTIGAVCMQSTPALLRRCGQAFLQALSAKQLDLTQVVSTLSGFAKVVSQTTPLSLDRELPRIDEPFLRRALTLVVDNHPATLLRETLALDAQLQQMRNKEVVKFWESAAGYAPTIGILGSVLGLLHVMSALEDPSKLGAGIAVSFVATLYGLALANLVCLPIANRLKAMFTEQAVYQELCIEAACLIANQENHRHITEHLQAFGRRAALYAQQGESRGAFV